ncbi:hypothetical protein ACFSQ7_18655 [Paenibacillus rhizoplanae]
MQGSAGFHSTLMGRSPTDPRRIRLERHIATCSYCSAEWALWQETSELMQDTRFDVSDERAEAINSKVMERIYLESPWLMPGDGKSAGSSAVFPASLKPLDCLFPSGVHLQLLIFHRVQDPPRIRRRHRAGSSRQVWQA